MTKKQATVSSRTIRQYSGRTQGLDASLAQFTRSECEDGYTVSNGTRLWLNQSSLPPELC